MAWFLSFGSPNNFSSFNIRNMVKTLPKLAVGRDWNLIEPSWGLEP